MSDYETKPRDHASNLVGGDAAFAPAPGRAQAAGFQAYKQQPPSAAIVPEPTAVPQPDPRQVQGSINAFGMHLIGGDILAVPQLGGQVSPDGARAVALSNHLVQQARVYAIIDEALKQKPSADAGLDDFETMLHYSAGWIVAGECTLTVLTPTHDSTARQPGKHALFDPTVVYPAIGGDYPKEASDADDPRLVFVDESIGGEMNAGGTAFHIAVIGDVSDQVLKQRIIHEVQHDADQSFPGQDYAEGPAPIFDDYRSEYRAFALMSGKGSGRETKYGSTERPAKNTEPFSIVDPHTQQLLGPVTTNFRNEYQENFSRAMMTEMPQFGVAYIKNPEFKAMVDAFDRVIGGNNLNSHRIDQLREAINACAGVADDDPALSAMEASAVALDELERRTLRDKNASRPFWDHAQKTLSATGFRRLEIALLGASSQPLVYIVKAGDWLAKIAEQHGIPLTALFKANPQLGPPARSWDKIFPGDQVFIPVA